MKIKTGNFEIIGNGNIIFFDQNPIEFELASDMIISVSVRMTDSEQRLEFHLNNNILEITVNLEEKSGEAENPEPIPVGTLNNKNLYFNFKLKRIKLDSKWNLNYTWYQQIEQEANNV